MDPLPYVMYPPPPGCKYEFTLGFIKIVYPSGHPRCGWIRGDPHLRTFDGVRYNFQAAGEFVGIETDDDNLEVQYRLRAMTPRVSVISAVAARVGKRRIVFTAGRGPLLWIDGEAADLSDGMFVTLTEDGALLLREGRRHTIVWPDGANLHVEDHRSYLGAFFLSPEARDGHLAGLFGDGDGDGTNDFRTRDGRILDSPPDFETRYGTFAESWRIHPEESLFDYEPGESTESFTDRSVPAGPAELEDLDPMARTQAEVVCRDAGVTEPDAFEECVLDVGFSGDETFIEAALAQQTPAALEPSPSPSTFRTGQGDELSFPLGERSFADYVTEHAPGGPGPAPDRPEADPSNVLGPPDHVRGDNYVSLGVGGSVTVAFTDNVLVDVPGPDLVVFEVGPVMEAFTVEISEDGSTFVEVGTMRRDEAAIDIGPVARPGARYTHVRLTDPGEHRSDRHRNNAGPDIDAVGAVGAELP